MRRILEEGRNCLSIEGADQSGLLIDGRAYYRAFYRAALEAKRYILMAGWQFDTNERLLRGEESKEYPGEVRLLSFLDSLCRRNPELRIYILAWDYSPIYALSREWLQEWVVNWKTNDRLEFRFDSQHAVGGSHHQKFVVVDGRLSFVGGLDLCCSRWDDRDHSPHNPLRVNSDGTPYRPFHDIQSFQTGPVAEQIAELFAARWLNATGEELNLPPPDPAIEALELDSALPLAGKRIAVSRTQGATLTAPDESVKEIRRLYIDAISAAEELIYIENQYLSSRDIYKAFMSRLKDRSLPPLQVIVILPECPTSFAEEATLGIAQAKILRTLKETAAQNGHGMGVYYSAKRLDDGGELPTYIHAKLLIVDDRFLSVGSANVSNRSMGLDSELNVSWEAESDRDVSLVESIRRVRLSLLEEHTGLAGTDEKAALGKSEGLVTYLESIAEGKTHRLRQHPMDTSFDHNPVLKAIMPEDLDLDPSKPLVEEAVYELLSPARSGLFAGGISSLYEWLGAQAAGGESKTAALSGRIKAWGRGSAPVGSTRPAALHELVAAYPLLRWVAAIIILAFAILTFWTLK